MANIEEKVEKLVEPIIIKIGYQLYDVEYVKEGKSYFLRIFIDKDGGVDLKDCEKVNDAISDILDNADYIKEQYFLEVSSPGIERILRKDWHLKQNIGNNVSVKLFKKDDNGKKNYQGELYEFNNDYIMLSINQENDEIVFKMKDDKKAKSKKGNNKKKNVDFENKIEQINNEKNFNIEKMKIPRRNISQIKIIYDWK